MSWIHHSLSSFLFQALLCFIILSLTPRAGVIIPISQMRKLRLTKLVSGRAQTCNQISPTPGSTLFCYKPSLILLVSVPPLTPNP